MEEVGNICQQQDMEVSAFGRKIVEADKIA